MTNYCASPFFHERRKTREVVVGDPAHGGVIIGGDHPVVVQSMITCDTMDTAASVQQTLDLVAVGCQIVRITAPTVKDAANLKNIVAELRARGCFVPIVADIHFKPDAAMEAAKWVEVVRVNPGNYADSKKFAVKEYTDEQYAAELKRIEEKFTPLVKLCQELGRAMRIGTNHGSLSDRIMNRFGDTPLGMVESALEFARIARANNYHNFKFSMKASNPKVMIECYRLLVARLDELGPDWNYPIHLGVTEAGEGEDGRIKSAIGIGSLLCDGLGDTIRVSLTEDSPHEIAVCHDLLAQIPILTRPLGEQQNSGVSPAASPSPLGGQGGVPVISIAGASNSSVSSPSPLGGERAGVRGGIPIISPGAATATIPAGQTNERTSLHPLPGGEGRGEGGIPLVSSGAATATIPAGQTNEGTSLHPLPGGEGRGEGGLPAVSNRAASDSFPFDPFHFERRATPEIPLSDNVKCGGEQTVRVVVTQATWDKVAPKIRPKDDVKPEAVYEDLNIFEVDPTQDFTINCDTQLVTVKDGVGLPAITAFRLLASKLKRLGANNPILLKDCLDFNPSGPSTGDGGASSDGPDFSLSPGERAGVRGKGTHTIQTAAGSVHREQVGVSSPSPLSGAEGWLPLEPKIALLRASAVIGALLADGIGDAILVRGESGGGQSLRLAYNILQAAGCRSFKTDYVACPSCGRTLFNLQTVTARIKARTDHLKGVKIAIMGCIVNGPGEMADADFGYVGGAPGKINLYVGKQAIKFNIPEAEAVDRLVDLIREHNKWVEPEGAEPVSQN